MTMPNERTRALIQSHDFLVQLGQDQALAESIRRQVCQILRYYPSSYEIPLAGKLEERRTDRITEQFLSSSVD